MPFGVAFDFYGTCGDKIRFVDGEILSVAQLRNFRDELHKQLGFAIDAVEKLLADGWVEPSLGDYYVDMWYPDINTEEEAREKLKAIGLAPDMFEYYDFWEDDDTEEFESSLDE